VIEDLFVVQLQLKLAKRKLESLKADYSTPDSELSEASEEVERLTDVYKRLIRLTKN
jgi:hypothetical protein